MIQKDVLEHVLGDAGSGEGADQAFAGQQGLGGGLQHHRVARDQRRSDGVDGGQIGIIPGRDDQDKAVRFTVYAAFEGVAVLDDQRGQGVLGNVGHVVGAFVDAAEFAAVADRPAHHVRDFKRRVVGHVAQRGDTGAHQVDAVRKGARGPVGLCGAGADDGVADRFDAGGRAGREGRAVDGRDAFQGVAHAGRPFIIPRSRRSCWNT